VPRCRCPPDSHLRIWHHPPPLDRDRLALAEAERRAAGPARPGLPAQGESFAALAAGFEVGTTTAWRYVNKAVALLAARVPKLRAAVREPVLTVDTPDARSGS